MGGVPTCRSTRPSRTSPTRRSIGCHPTCPTRRGHLLEHIRLTQADLLAYIRQVGYVAPAWPSAYWPARDARATPDQFARSVAGFRSDRAALRQIVADPATDLLATIPNTPGHTILREVRLVGDHNAYHLGEFAVLRQVMGTWPPDPEG